MGSFLSFLLVQCIHFSNQRSAGKFIEHRLNPKFQIRNPNSTIHNVSASPFLRACPPSASPSGEAGGSFRFA
jgi:hypothetical protein